MAARPRAVALAALALASLVLALRPLGAAAAADTGMTDEEALLAFKASFTNGDAVLPSWKRGTDVCAWTGVSCNIARHVATLCVGRPPRCAGLPLLLLRLGGGSKSMRVLLRMPPAVHAACCACCLLRSRMSLIVAAPAASCNDPYYMHTCRELVGLGLVGTAPQPDGWVLPSRLKELYFAENANVTGPIPPGWRLPDSERALRCMSARLEGVVQAGQRRCSHASAALLSLPVPRPHGPPSQL